MSNTDLRPTDSVKDLHGIGHATADRLANEGILSIQDLKDKKEPVDLLDYPKMGHQRVLFVREHLKRVMQNE